MLVSGATSVPEALSRDKLPQALVNLDKEVYTVSLAYDGRDRGVHIYITSVETQTHTHYWYDWTHRGFWPVSLQSDHEPTAVRTHRSHVALDTAVLLGGRDGYLRRYDDGAYTDDGGNEIPSYVMLGPLRLGGDDYSDGVLSELVGAMASDSGGVKWSVLVGKTHEAVVTASAHKTGVWAAGLNAKSHPRSRGGSAIVKLENNETNRAWAPERLSAVLSRRGKQRV